MKRFRILIGTVLYMSKMCLNFKQTAPKLLKACKVWELLIIDEMKIEIVKECDQELVIRKCNSITCLLPSY